MVKLFFILILINIQHEALAQKINFQVNACDYVNRLKNCSFKVQNEKNSKVSFARTCLQIDHESFLVHLCDGHQCLAKNAKETKLACGSEGTKLSTETLYFFDQRIITKSVDVAKEVCFQQLTSPANLSTKIRMNKTFKEIAQLFYTREASNKAKEFRFKTQQYRYLVFPPDPDAPHLLSSNGNFCLKLIWRELGFTHLWIARETGIINTVQIYDLEKNMWKKFSDLYPYCK